MVFVCEWVTTVVTYSTLKSCPFIFMQRIDRIEEMLVASSPTGASCRHININHFRFILCFRTSCVLRISLGIFNKAIENFFSYNNIYKIFPWYKIITLGEINSNSSKMEKLLPCSPTYFYLKNILKCITFENRSDTGDHV